MKIQIQCFAQLAQAAGTPESTLDLPQDATAQDALRAFAQDTTRAARTLLFNEDGELQPTILLFLDSEPILWSEPAPAHEGSTLFVATPIAGG
jgi:molybdopterin converting factor small subunit